MSTTSSLTPAEVIAMRDKLVGKTLREAVEHLEGEGSSAAEASIFVNEQLRVGALRVDGKVLSKPDPNTCVRDKPANYLTQQRKKRDK